MTGTVLITLLVLVGFAFGWTYYVTFHPKQTKTIDYSCSPEPERLPQAGEKLKLLNWNIQYMAGKENVFFYDLPGWQGPDTRPSSKEIQKATENVARIIEKEDPDFLLLQEVDEGAKRTDYEDQTQKLLNHLERGKYPCRAEAFYWKAKFIPHPLIWGSVGTKLVILSKYPIREAKRYQLPLIPRNWFYQQFNFKRAILKAKIPLQEGETPLVLMNTHLDAFAQGTQTMEKQVGEVKKLLQKHRDQGAPWVIGGDFNLLPPDPQAYEKLPESEKEHYKPDSPIKKLFEDFHAIPSQRDLQGPNVEQWYTHFPNDPSIKEADRTIDYLFYAENITPKTYEVKQKNTRKISDHFPLVMEFQIERSNPLN